MRFIHDDSEQGLCKKLKSREVSPRGEFDIEGPFDVLPPEQREVAIDAANRGIPEGEIFNIISLNENKRNAYYAAKDNNLTHNEALEVARLPGDLSRVAYYTAKEKDLPHEHALEVARLNDPQIEIYYTGRERGLNHEEALQGIL